MADKANRFSKIIEDGEQNDKSGKRITNQDKFKLSQVVNDAKLRISDFETKGELTSFDIEYKHDDYFFCIERTSLNGFSLTIKGITDLKPTLLKVSYDNLFSAFSAWVKDLASELNCPTGWETIN